MTTASNVESKTLLMTTNGMDAALFTSGTFHYHRCLYLLASFLHIQATQMHLHAVPGKEVETQLKKKRKKEKKMQGGNSNIGGMEKPSSFFRSLT